MEIANKKIRGEKGFYCKCLAQVSIIIIVIITGQYYYYSYYGIIIIAFKQPGECKILAFNITLLNS